MAPQSPAQRPLGTDVSNYQPDIYWPDVRNSGIVFAWSKATEGTTYTSPSFIEQQVGAKSVGIYVGAYHFARPSSHPNITGANSADSEANYFWSVAGNYIKGGSSNLVPMLDWEDSNATVAAGFTTTQMSQWVNQWCTTVSNLARASGITIKPVVYTGVWISQPSGTYPGLNTTVTNWPSWIASYNGQNIQTGGPTSTFPWSTWNIWQYADTNWSGGDSDVLKGGYTNLDSFVIGGLPPGPFITKQPVNHRALDPGKNVSFAAAALGRGALQYQWRFNNTNILNATNTSLTVSNVTAPNAGLYSFVVSDFSGSVTSTPVSLFVYPVQTAAFADNFDVNTGPNWIQNRSSSDTAVTFSFDYSALGIPSAPNSAGGTTRGVQMKANLASNVAAALSISPTNQNFSGDHRLHFDAWINVNGPFPGGGLGSTEFLTAGIGTSGNRAEWTGNASADGFYFSVTGEGGSGSTAVSAADVNAYVGPTVQTVAGGSYWAGKDVTSRDHGNYYYTEALPGNAPAPALQQANFPQQTGRLDTGTFGLTWHDVIVSRRGNIVDWVIDGVRFATISNATFTASNVFVGFWDPFTSLSSNNVINFGLVDNVRVEVPAIAPAFVTVPFSRTVKLGTNVTFTSSATGLPGAAYQWRFNGTNISSATNASYSLAFVGTTNVGSYSVMATNVAGLTLSTNAMLSLVAPAAGQFTGIANAGGDIQITLVGDPYWTYTVEVSTNLVNWNVFTNLSNASGLFGFQAGASGDAPQRFFRARVGP
ncbi:MAG: GH25 family lysozyme [Verrucomicrobiota bacterium]